MASSKELIKNALKLVRYKNLTLITLTQFVLFFTLINGGKTNADYLTFVAITCATLLIASGGYMINDYIDVKIDSINKPDGVIINRSISGRKVLFLYWIVNFLGVLIGFKIHTSIGLICLSSMIFLWIYSNYLKRTLFWGNFVVSLFLGLSLLIFYPIYFNRIDVSWLLFYSFFAFIIGLIREIVKDMEDIEGDAQNGCKTFPISLGIAKTKMIIIYLTLFVISTLVYFLMYLFRTPYGLIREQLMTSYLFLFIVIPLGYFLIKMYRSQTNQDFAFASKILKVVMLTGILSMFFKVFEF